MAPRVVGNITLDCNLECKEGNNMAIYRQEGACLFFAYNLMFRMNYEFIHSVYFSPYLLFPSPRILVFLPLIPTHQLTPLIACKIKATSVKYSSSVLSYILVCNRLQRPLCLYIWLCLLRRHLKITSASFHSFPLPPWVLRKI